MKTLQPDLLDMKEYKGWSTFKIESFGMPCDPVLHYEIRMAEAMSSTLVLMYWGEILALLRSNATELMAGWSLS